MRRLNWRWFLYKMSIVLNDVDTGFLSVIDELEEDKKNDYHV